MNKRMRKDTCMYENCSRDGLPKQIWKTNKVPLAAGYKSPRL